MSATPADEIVGPFSELTRQIVDALRDAVLPGPGSTFWWPLLLITLLFTVAFWVFRKGRGAKGADGNVGIFSLLYALNGNFRHYHVSFRYPRCLEKWLQSPGMHHTHHSYLEKHWDTNLGLVTSIWDRIFGTLYVADRFEETPWGLTSKDQREYSSLSDNLLTPFKEIYRILRRQPKVYPTEPATMASHKSQP